MRYLFYYKNIYGALILRYSDDDGKHITNHFIGYTPQEAIQRFREKYGLKRKHIAITTLDARRK